MFFNSTIGDFTATVYSVFINSILFFTYLILSLILYFKSNTNKYFYYLLLIPITFVFTSIIWRKNLHKQVVLEGYIENTRSTRIKLFNNNSFEIELQYPHHSEFKKGNYETNGNEIVLKRNNIEQLTDSLFTKKYIIIENERLEPINIKNFQIIIMHKKSYN